MDRAFKALVEVMNSQIQSLIARGYLIYDADNRDYFISGIRYDNQDDKMIFETVEDRTQKEDGD